MSINKRLAFGLAWALGAGITPVCAESPRLGVQIHGNVPTGGFSDTVDDQIGLGGGLHMTFDLGRGHMLRPRADYLAFPEASRDFGTVQIHRKVSAVSAGLDYLYFFKKKPDGFYLTGGLSMNRWTVKTNEYIDQTDRSNKLGFSMGVGYNFNSSLGAEVRYTNSSSYASNNAHTPFRTSYAIQTGVTWRF